MRPLVVADGGDTLPRVLAVVVLRNVLRNLGRLAPMIGIVVVVFAAMLLGNAVLGASGRALYRTYAQLVSGDLSVSPAGETNFTIFGSDQLLIGNLLVQPTIPDFSELEAEVAALPGVRAVSGLVSTQAGVELPGTGRTGRTVFGVDPERYLALFPQLELVAGGLPQPGEPGVVLQVAHLPAELTPAAALGQPVLLAAAVGQGFTLREAPVTGVFRYPVSDALLDNVVLSDVDTARALNGYVYGALDEVEISADAQQALESDVDALFGGAPEGDADAGPADSPASGSGTQDGGLDLDALLGPAPSAPPADSEPAAPAGDPAGEPALDPAAPQDRARQTIAGAWNFLLIGLNDPADRPAVMRELAARGYGPDTGYRVRDWYRTVGGNASLVRYLQILFNAGLIFVAVGAAIIAANALVLSVLERRAEIGTMRALGAPRGRVARMIGLETLLVVTGAATLGIAAGALGVRLLNGAGYVVGNQYLAILFGGEPVRGTVTAGLVGAHLLAALGLSAAALVYPLKKALDVTPREAMAA
mgnify:CR=1 FL=1